MDSNKKDSGSNLSYEHITWHINGDFSKTCHDSVPKSVSQISSGMLSHLLPLEKKTLRDLTPWDERSTMFNGKIHYFYR